MKIVLDRYFGNDRGTKSVLYVTDNDGEVLMQCEAREPRFADYAEAFKGCSSYCLAVGEYPCKPFSTVQSPMTLTVVKSPGHRCTRFGWDECKQMRMNTILVGEADEDDAPYRKLYNQREVFDRLTRLVYRAYIAEESITLEVTNESTLCLTN